MDQGIKVTVRRPTKVSLSARECDLEQSDVFRIPRNSLRQPDRKFVQGILLVRLIAKTVLLHPSSASDCPLTQYTEDWNNPPAAARTAGCIIRRS